MKESAAEAIAAGARRTPRWSCNEPATKVTQIIRRVVLAGSISSVSPFRHEFVAVCQRHAEILEAEGWHFERVRRYENDLRCRYADEPWE